MRTHLAKRLTTLSNFGDLVTSKLQLSMCDSDNFDSSALVSIETRQEAMRLTQEAGLCAEELCLFQTMNNIAMLALRLKEPYLDFSALAERVRTVGEQFALETSSLQFLCFEGDEGTFYEMEHPFGKLVSDRFPSSVFDSREAGNCIAQGRYTASVMHAMRSIESAVAAVGRKLKVKKKNSGWGTDLKAFEKKWNTKLKNNPRITGQMRTFYPSIFPAIRAFAYAWRNRAMHSVKARYGKDEARYVFKATKEFMSVVATRLRESKRRSKVSS